MSFPGPTPLKSPASFAEAEAHLCPERSLVRFLVDKLVQRRREPRMIAPQRLPDLIRERCQLFSKRKCRLGAVLGTCGPCHAVAKRASQEHDSG